MIELKIGGGDGRRIRRAAMLCLCLAVALWIAYAVREIWAPLLIALLIAMVLDPLVDWMEERGWSRLKGAIVIYLAFFGLAATTLTLAVPEIISQTVTITKSIGQYLPNTENETQTKRSLERLLHKFHATPVVETSVLNASRQISAAFGRTSSWIGQAAEGMLSNLLWLVVVPVVSFYLLKDFHLLFARVLLLIPRDRRTEAQRIINEIVSIFIGYLRGMLIVCVSNALATTALLMLFHVPNALALGAIAGVLYVVPYLGPVLTYAMVGGSSLVGGSLSLQTTLLVLGLLVVLHSVIFDQIVTPRVIGKHVGLHPVLSIIALLMGGVLLGLVGMILAVPVAAVVQMALLSIFPKLAQPIEVPSGQQIHVTHAEAQTGAEESSEPEPKVEAHQTIVEAVDTAEDEAPNPSGLQEVSVGEPRLVLLPESFRDAVSHPPRTEPRG